MSQDLGLFISAIVALLALMFVGASLLSSPRKRR